MKHKPVKSWIDHSIIEEFQIKENKRKDSEGVIGHIHTSSNNSQFQLANTKLLSDLIIKGLKPKWFAVIHFNDGGNSKKYQNRRLDPEKVEEDLGVVKDAIYTQLYGRKWEEKKNRSKSIWGTEYGHSSIKPHINILFEGIPITKFRFEWFLNHTLPKKVQCLWKQSADLQPVFYENGIIRYITKECDMTNSNISLRCTDFF